MIHTENKSPLSCTLFVKFQLLNSLASREQCGRVCLIQKQLGEDMFTCIKVSKIGGTWLAQSVRHETLKLRSASSSLTLGVEPYLKKKFFN